MQVCTGVVFALASNFWVLVAAATIGVISPSGVRSHESTKDESCMMQNPRRVI
jgi:hypothetical protein